MHKRLGFTIVELLIVIVVIGILVSIVLVSYTGISQQSKTVALEGDLITAANTLDTIKSQNGAYPSSLSTAQAAGLSFTTGITPQYTFFAKTSSVPGHYCLTTTRDGISSHIANGGVPTRGPCVGHTGTAPTDPDEGGDCPSGYVVVPGSSYFHTKSFCVMKYEAKNVGGVATSQASGTPWVSISQTSASSTAESACADCHLITDNEWMTIAANVLSVSANWSGGAVGSGYIYSGHNDNSPVNPLAASTDNDGYSGTGNTTGSNQKRTLTLTNGATIWDLAGNVWEWTSQQLVTSNVGIPGDSGFAWREWNNGSLTLGNLPTASSPSAISNTVATWSSAQGIGKIYANYGDATTRAFLRSGNWYSGVNAGILELALSGIPSYVATDIGFRVAR